jgi:hypothetical protein
MERIKKAKQGAKHRVAKPRVHTDYALQLHFVKSFCVARAKDKHDVIYADCYAVQKRKTPNNMCGLKSYRRYIQT